MSSTNLDVSSSSLINNDHQTPSTPTPPTKQTQSKSSTTSSSVINTNTNTNNNTAAGEYLLERLRILLNRLQSTTEILHNWPETQGDSAKAHVETCSELITSIRKIVLGVRSVERHVNGTGTGLTPSSTCGSSSSSSNTPQLASISPEALIAFQTSLDTKCPIPLDLLDLLDVSTTTTATSNTSSIFGLNPQVYIRGLLKESIRQLAGLERRKHALNMLATSIEEGMIAMNSSSEKKEEGKVEEEGTTDGKEEESIVKRKREYDKNNIEGEGESVKKIQRVAN